MSAGPRTAYARGAAFEREVKRAFEAAGWIVTRSPKSAGVYDLQAGRPGSAPLIIQCKKGGKCCPHEWNALLTFAREKGAVALIAERPPRGALKLWLLTGPKGMKRARQPWEPWELTPIFPGNTGADDGTKSQEERAD